MLRLIRALIPERCALCGEPVEYGRESPFCRVCHVKWEAEKGAVRREAFGQAVAEYAAADSTGSVLAPHVTGYNPEKHETASAAILFKLKHSATPRVVTFLAAELAAMLTQCAGELLCEYPEEFVVTFVPRSPAAIRRDGYDHMERCAKETAKQLGIAFEKSFDRLRGALEQKRLDADGRRENARETIRLSTAGKRFPKNHANERSRSGKRYILIDDIVTTGASLDACAQLLRADGAQMVLFASIAATERNLR